MTSMSALLAFLAFAGSAGAQPKPAAAPPAAPPAAAKAEVAPAGPTSAPGTPAKAAAAPVAAKPAAAPATAPAAMPPAPKPAPELETFKFFLGRWKCDGKASVSPLSPTEHAVKATAEAKMEVDNFWQSFAYEEMKTKDTDAIFANVHAARQESSDDPESLEISIDTKAKVNEGDYSRGGKKPDRLRGEDARGVGP